MARITKKLVDGLKLGKKDELVWDSELKGFGVRAKPTGVKSFVIQYRNSNARSRRYTIGQYGRMTVDVARKEARRLLSDVSLGLDPADEKNQKRNTLSVASFSKIYMEEYAPGRKRESSLKTDAINLQKHLLPALGSRAITDVSKADVRKLQQTLRDRPGAANRTVALLSNMLNVAEQLGYRPEGPNPCRGVESLLLQKRERYITDSEFSRLGRAISSAEENKTVSASALAAIKLLILTGCRKSEILTLRWSYVDMESRVLRLPQSKTGAKPVYLNEHAMEVLRNLRSEGSEWVLPSADLSRHIVNLRKPWTRIRSAASIEDVRLHDLRHTFASVAVSSGESMPMIGKMLGHTQAKTTQKYAHLDDDPVKAASERIGQTIQNAMRG